MKKFLFYFSYIGTKFRGIQLDYKLGEKDRSISKILQDSLQVLKPLNQPVVTISSRTDAGVHAINSTFHTLLQLPDIRPLHIRKKNIYSFLKNCDEETYVTHSLNRFFENASLEIRIRKSLVVPETFHCRHSAVQRTYLYRFAFKSRRESVYTCLDDHFPISEINKCYFVEKNLDINAIKSACSFLNGTHDFRQFCKFTRLNKGVDTVKTLDKVLLVPGRPFLNPLYDISNDYEDLQFWDLIISSKSFLYNQIRRIVAYLIAIGEGTADLENLKNILSNPEKWDPSMRIAPTHGLYLLNVKYPAEAFLEKRRSNQAGCISK
ncbi:UNVERIFIED_CONTAM: hypothetical protein RMT77_002957 [Armadillidium vulgare]